MNAILDKLTEINGIINTFIWNEFGLLLLLGTGLLLTIATGFFQVTHIGHWWKNTIGSVFKKNSDATKKTDKKSI